MAVVQRSEFTLALNQIASERGVDPEVVLETIKNAILAAYRKDHEIENEEEYSVELDEKTGETRILHNSEDITPPGFGRIAAQTAKQVLLQKIREREKDAVIEEYSKRLGSVVNGNIIRFQGPNIIVDIGKAEAMMPSQQRIPNESYFLNKKIPVYIVEINEEKGREIIVSRSHPGLIEGLFRREVPEVASGSVVIKEIVREPGSRAKVAVYSEQSGIDPVGSCVGQKGVRIQAVIDALDGLEKIDVIQWSPEPAKFIVNALSPAKNVTVDLDDEEKIAHVHAPQEELPLVIGRDGQNVRLASKLTRYNIEVQGDEAPKVAEDDHEEVAVEATEVVDEPQEKVEESTEEITAEPAEIQEADATEESTEETETQEQPVDAEEKDQAESPKED